MKYVYVVLSGCYGDIGIDSIYSSEQKAQQRVEKINSTAFGRSTEPFVEQWEVNKKPE